MGAGIYRIVNVHDGKCYIGQSQRLSDRFNDHRWKLRNAKHHNPHLASAWAKYGEAAFRFEVVQDVDDVEMLGVYESAWFFITMCCDRDHGYNVTADAVAPNRGRKFGTYSRERVEAAAAPRRGKPLTAECRSNMSISQKRRREREALLKAA